MDFLLRERISGQWLGFLQAMSEELQAQLEPKELRELLRGIGVRQAQALPMEAQDTVEALEAAMNVHLQRMRWGYVELSDTGDYLQVRHKLCPLPTALGLPADVAGGVLEGLYECWFRNAGAEDGLTAVQSPAGADAAALEFKFGQN
jgi:hypothetical protein